MAEKLFQIHQLTQKDLDRLNPTPQDIEKRVADIYTVAGAPDVIAGIEYDQDITGQMEDLAFEK